MILPFAALGDSGGKIQIRLLKTFSLFFDKSDYGNRKQISLANDGTGSLFVSATLTFQRLEALQMQTPLASCMCRNFNDAVPYDRYRRTWRLLRLLRRKAYSLASGIFPRQFPKGVTPYGGSSWFNLTGECVAYLVDYACENPHFVSYTLTDN